MERKHACRPFHYEGSSLLYAGCLCGEYWAVALRRGLISGRPRCRNCADTRHPRGTCSVCMGEGLPIERHHIARRKWSKETAKVCLNCHAILSHRQCGWGDRDTDPECYRWQGKVDMGFLSLLRRNEFVQELWSLWT